MDQDTKAEQREKRIVKLLETMQIQLNVIQDQLDDLTEKVVDMQNNISADLDIIYDATEESEQG